MNLNEIKGFHTLKNKTNQKKVHFKFWRIIKKALLLVAVFLLLADILAQTKTDNKPKYKQKQADTDSINKIKEILGNTENKIKSSNHSYSVEKHRTIFRKDDMRYLHPKEKLIWDPEYFGMIFRQATEDFQNGAILFYRAILKYDAIRNKYSANMPYSLFAEKLFLLSHKNLHKSMHVLDFIRKFEIMNEKDDPVFRELYLATNKLLAMWEMYYGHNRKAIEYSNKILVVDANDIDAIKIRFICANKEFFQLHKIAVKDQNPLFPMERYLRMRKLKNDSLKLLVDLSYKVGDKKGDNLRKNFINFNIKRSQDLLQKYLKNKKRFSEDAERNFREKWEKRMKKLKEKQQKKLEPGTRKESENITTKKDTTKTTAKQKKKGTETKGNKK